MTDGAKARGARLDGWVDGEVLDLVPVNLLTAKLNLHSAHCHTRTPGEVETLWEPKI